MRAEQLPTAHYGVSDLTPPDARERLTDALGGVQRDGREHVVHGRPLPLPDDAAPLEAPLGQLADSAEAPGPAPGPAAPSTADTLAAVRGALGAALAALDALTPEEWDG